MQAGIIGYGYMGQIRETVLCQLPKFQVKKIYHPDLEDSPLFTNELHSIIIDPEIEAVFICTPNHLIKDLVIDCLKAGKHVFAEKPPGISSAEVKEMAEAEKKYGKVLKFGFNHRYHPAIIKAKELISDGSFGDILWMRGRYGKSVDPNFDKNWRSKKEFTGGGILMDQGIHMLDLLLHFCGEFDDAKAFASNSYWQGEVEDNVFAILKNKKGQTASLHSTMTQWRYLFSLEIFLSQGYVVVNGLLSKSGRYGPERLDYAVNRTPSPMAAHSEVHSLTFNTDNSWKMEIQEFYDAVIGKQPVQIGTTADALKLMQTIEMIYKDAGIQQ